MSSLNDLNNVNANGFLDKKTFCRLINKNILGNYQFSNGYFIYRDLKNPIEIEKVQMNDIINSIKYNTRLNLCVELDLRYERYKYSIVVSRNKRTLFSTIFSDNIFECYIDLYKWSLKQAKPKVTNKVFLTKK